MGKEITRTVQRDEIMNAVKDFLEQHFETWCEYCGSGELLMPAIDENGEEFYFKFKGSIPRGTRKTNGEKGYNAFDGDGAIKEWRETQEAKAAEKAAKEADKKRKQAEKERKQKAKQVVHDLNKKGFKALITEPIEDEDKDDEHQFLSREVMV